MSGRGWLDGKVAVITGAGTGIGAATAPRVALTCGSWKSLRRVWPLVCIELGPIPS